MLNKIDLELRWHFEGCRDPGAHDLPLVFQAQRHRQAWQNHSMIGR